MGPYVLVAPSPFTSGGIEVNRPAGGATTRLFWVKVGDTGATGWTARLDQYLSANPDIGYNHNLNVTVGNNQVGKWIEERLFLGNQYSGAARAVFQSAHAGVQQTSEWHAVYGPNLADMQNLVTGWNGLHWTGVDLNGVLNADASLRALFALIPVACADPNN